MFYFNKFKLNESILNSIKISAIQNFIRNNLSSKYSEKYCEYDFIFVVVLLGFHTSVYWDLVV